MVTEQLAGRDIRQPRVLEAMRNIPRHLFVPLAYRDDAYADCPLPIGYGQTISQPYIVALMTQALELDGSETVLEIGTGSGYQTAVLAKLVKFVYSVERHAPLAAQARQRLADLNLLNTQVITGDGSLGLADYAPYQALMVTAAAPEPPRPLLNQLAQGGRLVIPIGRRWEQSLQIWVRHGDDFETHKILPVAFVPLRGKHGWNDSDWAENDR